MIRKFLFIWVPVWKLKKKVKPCGLLHYTPVIKRKVNRVGYSIWLIFHIFHQNICCTPSLEPSGQDGPSEGSQTMILLKTIHIRKLSLNYLEYSLLFWALVYINTQINNARWITDNMLTMLTIMLDFSFIQASNMPTGHWCPRLILSYDLGALAWTGMRFAVSD